MIICPLGWFETTHALLREGEPTLIWYCHLLVDSTLASQALRFSDSFYPQSLEILIRASRRLHDAIDLSFSLGPFLQ